VIRRRGALTSLKSLSGSSKASDLSITSVPDMSGRQRTFKEEHPLGESWV